MLGGGGRAGARSGARQTIPGRSILVECNQVSENMWLGVLDISVHACKEALFK
jgi:hypothetical protein